MDPKIGIIVILFLTLLIFGLLFYKKMWIFNYNNIIKFKTPTKEGGCSTDLKTCTCPIEVEYEDGKIEKKVVNSFDMEKDYYKVKQDIMPYWSNWGECSPYGIKNRNRIYGDTNKFDMFGVNGLKDLKTKSSDKNYYKVHSCDLIPCENYGSERNTNICRIRSEGELPSDSDDLKNNTARCDPIMTFQDNSAISNSCRGGDQIPLLTIDTNTNNQLNFNENGFGDDYKENFKFGYFRQRNTGVKDPVLIGINNQLHQ